MRRSSGFTPCFVCTNSDTFKFKTFVKRETLKLLNTDLQVFFLLGGEEAGIIKNSIWPQLQANNSMITRVQCKSDIHHFSESLQVFFI